MRDFGVLVTHYCYLWRLKYRGWFDYPTLGWYPWRSIRRPGGGGGGGDRTGAGKRDKHPLTKNKYPRTRPYQLTCLCGVGGKRSGKPGTYHSPVDMTCIVVLCTVYLVDHHTRPVSSRMYYGVQRAESELYPGRHESVFPRLPCPLLPIPIMDTYHATSHLTWEEISTAAGVLCRVCGN